MDEQNKALIIVKNAKEDLAAGKISRREFNSIMMTFGAVAGYTLFGSFAEAWTGTRMRKSSSATLDYQIQRSLRFRANASAYLTRTPSSAGDRKTFTWSTWLKRGKLSLQNIFQAGATPGGTVLYFGSDDCLHLTLYISAAETFVTSQVFRDTAAWYHIVIAVDTTQATSSNRVKLYVNGSQVTAFSTINYPSQNTTVTINSTTAHTFGLSTSEVGGYLDAYQSDIYFVDGQALSPTSFGQADAKTGAWSPKKYAGTYGTNGFYLPFTDTSSTTNLVKDSSSNANNWTPNNISLTAGVNYDSMTDVPLTYGTTDKGNYCVLTPLGGNTWNGFPIEGNLKTSTNGNASGNYTSNGTIAAAAKTYYEVTIFNCNLVTGGTAGGVGYVDANTVLAGNAFPGSQANSFGFMPSGGSTAWISKKNAAANTTLSLTGIANGDVIGVAYDPINGNAWVSKNGVWNGSGNPSTGANPDLTGIASTNHVPAITPYYDGSSVINHICNFGQRPFSYTVPTGFAGLHTGNFPAPTIVKPNQYFDVATYTGTAATKTISTDGNGNNLVLAPDLVWIKSRSSGANNHVIFDSSRGVGNYIMPSTTSGEFFNAGMLTSFNTNGFSLGADSTTAVNGSGLSHVAWMWKKGVTPGFDVVTYTGDGTSARTISHSLGVVPKMIIVKGRTSAASWSAWQVYHASLATPATSFLRLNETANYTGYADAWNSTLPTSSNFSIRNNAGAGINGNGDTFAAYLFAEVTGFSKFGSYTGNGSTDGPFVYCGFKSRWIMLKRTDSSSNWQIYDTTRETSNKMYLDLSPNSTEGENSVTLNLSDAIDITATGFKLRATGANCELNVSGATYIFAAFAETPLKYATAR